MELLVRVTALLLAAVFAWAASAKLRDRRATTNGFSALGLPRPDLLAWAVPALELVIAALLVLRPVWGAEAAVAALVGFTVQLWPLVRSGRPVSCNCFGGTSTEPVSARSLVRNGVLLALAVFVALAG